MGVYIKGMEMPKRDATFLVHVNGDVIDITAPRKYGEDYHREKMLYKLIEVPPHGRLIDADAVTEAVELDDLSTLIEVMHFKDVLRDVPTILPADEG